MFRLSAPRSLLQAQLLALVLLATATPAALEAVQADTPAVAHPAASNPADVPVGAARAAAMEAFSAGRYGEAADRLKPLADGGDAPSAWVLGFMTDLGLGVTIHDGRSLDLIQAAAAAGHQPAVRFLAWKYASGFGVARDPAAERKWRYRTDPTADPAAPLPAGWLDYLSTDARPNVRRAADWLVARATEGNSTACYNLYRIHDNRMSRRDEGLALAYLDKAAGLGHPLAVRDFLVLAEQGRFGEDGMPAAYERLRKAAQGGDAELAAALGARLLRGTGVYYQPAEGMKWLEFAARNGVPQAWEVMGDALLAGGQVARNESLARECYRQGAAAGLVESTVSLAQMTEEGAGGPADPAAAVPLYQRALAMGSNRARHNLARLWTEGPAELRRPEAGLQLLREAANAGYIPSMRRLGIAHRNGELGVERSESTGFDWLERAAAAGDARSQIEVGQMLLAGTGAAPDATLAAGWFERAANNGLPQGWIELAEMFETGRGVPKDHERALNYYGIAAERGGAREGAILVSALRTHKKRDAWIDGAMNLLDARIRRGDPAAGVLLAELLLRSDTDYRDDTRARTLLEDAAATGTIQAKARLAEVCLNGRGGPRNPVRAEKLAEEVYSAGNALGGIILGRIRLASPDGAKRVEGAKLLRSLAAKGLYSAWYELAVGLASDALPPEEAEDTQNAINGAMPALPQVLADAIWKALTPVSFPAPPAEAELKARIAALKRDRNSPPVPVYQVPPVFPPLLNRTHMEGDVELAFTVDANGRTQNIEVQSSNHPLFSAAAIRAVLQWRFAPGLEKNRPRAMRVIQAFPFRLNEAGAPDDIPGQ